MKPLLWTPVRECRDLEVFRGVNPSETSPNGQIPVLSIHRLESEREAAAYVDQLPKNAPQLGDVLVSLSSPNLGQIHIVKESDPAFVVDHNSVIVRSTAAALDPRFLGYWMRTPGFVEELNRLSRGVFRRLSFRDFGSIEIPIPDLEFQHRWISDFEQTEVALEAHRRNVRELEKFIDLELGLLDAEIAELG